MKTIFYDFLLMIQFFTRIPVNKSLPCKMENFKRGTAMFPLIGLLLGGIQYGLYLVFRNIFPDTITTIFIIAVGVVLSGGLHQDGFGDIFDGFFSFKGDKYKIIEVMKDSRIGTFAGLALIFDILVKYAAISFIISKNMPLVIIAAPVVARATVVFVALVAKNAKETGTGNFFVGNTGIVQFIISLIIASGLCVLFIGIKNSIIVIPIAFIVTILFLQLCNKKIGGVTGDALGANYEFAEMTVLIIFTALLK